jgi:hypothetical protein
MKLTVTGVEDGQEQFKFLWGFYVRGFKPWEHCQKCLRGTRADGIFPSMGNSEVLLPRPTDYFYLCGYAKGAAANRGKYNLHLAVEPMPGETASVASKYGPVFTIDGARRIVIPNSDEPRAAYGEFDYRCMNFRFGKLMYPTPVIGPTAPRVPILKS